MKKVCIILLNWNNWQDTLECLESLYRLDYPDFQIVVCDNGSTDDTAAKIRAWAAGDLDILAERSNNDANCKPCSKPIAMIEYDRKSLCSGNDIPAHNPLVFINNGANLGFAGGNNVGLRYVLDTGAFDYCWVLNNDTVVAVDALQKLVDRMSLSPVPGICGSTILEYRSPEMINALGGAIYSRWLGLAWHLGRGRRWPRETDAKHLEKCIDYVVGASMFVSLEFLQKVGLMNESYFLYYEELDWAMRARNQFSLAWAADSVVYHKVGGSIGTSSHPARKSAISDFYTMRNRIRFTREHCRYALPTIYLGLVCAVLVRLLFGQWRRAAMVARLMIHPSISFDDCCRF